MNNYTYWSHNITKKPKHYTADLINRFRRYEIKFYTHDDIIEYYILDVPFNKEGQVDLDLFCVNFELKFKFKLDVNNIDEYLFGRDRGYISYINKIELTPDEMSIFKNVLRKEKLITIMNKFKKDE